MKKTFKVFDVDFNIVGKNRVEVVNPDSYIETLFENSYGFRKNIYNTFKDIIGVEKIPDEIYVKIGKKLYKLSFEGDIIDTKKSNLNTIFQKIAEEIDKNISSENKEEKKENEQQEEKMEIEKAAEEKLKQIEQNFIQELDKIKNDIEKYFKDIDSEGTSKKACYSEQNAPTPKHSDIKRYIKIVEEYLKEFNDPVLNLSFEKIKNFLLSGIPKETNNEPNILADNELIVQQKIIKKIIKMAQDLAYEKVDINDNKIDELSKALEKAKNLNIEEDIKEMIKELESKIKKYKENKREADAKSEFQKTFTEESNKTDNVNEAVKNTMKKMKEKGFNVEDNINIKTNFKIGDKVWFKFASVKDESNFGIIKELVGNKAIVDWGDDIPTEENLDDLEKEIDINNKINIFMPLANANMHKNVIKKDSRYDAELFSISFTEKFKDLEDENKNGKRIKIGKFEGTVIDEKDGKVKIKIDNKNLISLYKYQI